MAASTQEMQELVSPDSEELLVAPDSEELVAPELLASYSSSSDEAAAAAKGRAPASRPWSSRRSRSSTRRTSAMQRKSKKRDPQRAHKKGPRTVPCKNMSPAGVDPATSCVETPCANQFEAGLACGLGVPATLFNRGKQGKLYPN